MAAAAAKSLQSCPTLSDPIDGSPPGSAIPGILQARTLEWVVIFFSNAWKWKVKVKLLSRVRLLVTPWTAAYQAPLSMELSRQEYWSGLPLPFPPIVWRSYLIVVSVQKCFRSGKGKPNLLLNLFYFLWNIIPSWNIFDTSITKPCSWQCCAMYLASPSTMAWYCGLVLWYTCPLTANVSFLQERQWCISWPCF